MFTLRTPFIKAIQPGGTLYVFVEAINDFTGSILPDAQYKFEFSHFVLLQLPNIAKINTDPTTSYNNIDDILNFVPNKLWWQNLGESFFVHPPSTDYNKQLSEVIQGYILNQEVCIMLDSNYDDSQLQTISEFVFWKTINHFGGIRIQPIDTTYASNLLSDDALSEHLNTRYYLTEFNFTPVYDPSGNYQYVIKYIGKIDWVNVIRNPGTSYVEFYLHIPSYVGRLPFVLLESVQGFQNYQSGMAYVTPEANIDDLIGRAGQTNPSGLLNQAYYDVHNSVLYPNDHQIYDFATNTWVIQDIIHSTNVYGSYQTLQNFVPTSLSNTDSYRLVKKGTDNYYVMSMVDGIKIVFDLSKYRTNASSWTQFQTGTAPFTFNCALVYYDIIDVNDNRTTNLFGILVFDQVKQSGTEHTIPVLLKNIDSPSGVGHSYSFRIIHAFDTDQSYDVNINVINRETNFSIELVSDAFNRIIRLQSLLDQQLQIVKDTESIIKSKSLLIDRIVSLQDQVNQLSQVVSVTNLQRIDVLLSRISDLEEQVNKINTDIVSYIRDNNIITGGNGITVAYGTNSIVINRDDNVYNNITTVDINSFANQTSIVYYPNMIVLLNQGGPTVVNTDKTLYLDESVFGFVNNSIIRVICTDKLWTNTVAKLMIKRQKDDFVIHEYTLPGSPQSFMIDVIIADESNNRYISYVTNINNT